MAKVNWNFADELKRFGPSAPPWHGSLEEAQAYAAWVTKTHYENFSVASLLLPRNLVTHFQAVYGYCRWADDLGDETGDEAEQLLQWWREQLLQCYQGGISHPVFRALRATIDEFQIPPEPFLDLTSAFEQDQRVNRYQTFEQLVDYCRRSANPVGRLVLYVCRAFTPENARLSDFICTGLQLTNFWQDVRRDLDNLNRVYIPEEDRQRFGYSEEALLNRQITPEFRELLKFEVERTRDLFNQGEPLLVRLPSSVRSDIELFLRGGRAILDRIESLRYDVWTTRPRLTKLAKSRLILGTLSSRIVRRFL